MVAPSSWNLALSEQLSIFIEEKKRIKYLTSYTFSHTITLPNNANGRESQNNIWRSSMAAPSSWNLAVSEHLSIFIEEKKRIKYLTSTNQYPLTHEHTRKQCSLLINKRQRQSEQYSAIINGGAIFMESRFLSKQEPFSL
ncbi:hypothetical protein SLA2020_143630 [Shorea laevis]